MKKYVVLVIMLLSLLLSACHTADSPVTDGTGDGESSTEYLPSTSQNETDKYSYSSAIISSGYSDIRPIAAFLSTTLYESGEPTLNGCGEGAYHVFSDPETKISDFPTLVASGEVTATSPENARLGNPRLYNVNYESYAGYSDLVWSELHLLPAGEYIVVFNEYGDTRNTSEETETYWLSHFENVFRLIVPEK